ncbi:hypothetical protein F0344_12765 [Streptomyces finlayi]|uniref:Uncharacterized protein n=1 Tax=Streptomyces finlayi TaxID=67296 RepID=A0A7G7BJ60_9ACTN|nr:hypothetical protein [Streptomyces finlayi]QNE75375.1 hypothetical protein F0344_12765 [Streptomyces finlayi]
MTTSETSRFVRLRVEMVLEITDAAALTGSALAGIAAEYAAAGIAPAPGESAEERTHAEATVREDGAEAIASLVDPFDLVSEVPGVELAQASWSSETVDYDPDAEDWSEDWDGDEDDDESGYGFEGAREDGEVEDNGQGDGERADAER